MNNESVKTAHNLMGSAHNRLKSIQELSALRSYAEFTDICDEAKRRLVQQALEDNKYSFHLAARNTGYSNGGMYGLFKTLFNAHDVASKANIIKNYFENYEPSEYSEEQEHILSFLTQSQNREELEGTISSAEGALFRSALERCDYNNTAAAEILGVGRKMIARKRQIHSIEQPIKPDNPVQTIDNDDLHTLSHQLSEECSYNDLNKVYDELRRHHLANALNESGFNIGQAAKALGYERSTFKENFERRFKISKFDIDSADNAIQQWKASEQIQSPALDTFLTKAPTPETAHALYKAAHKVIIAKAFNDNNTNQTQTAQALGIDRMTLKHHLTRYDLLNNQPNIEQTINTAPPPPIYNMTEVAKAFSEHMSFKTVTNLQTDMTRSLLKRALERTECNFQEAAEMIELQDNMFANGCRNYLQGVKDGDPSSLAREKKPHAPDHQSVIDDILPAIETYKDLTQLFDSAKKLIIQKTLGEQGQNMLKTSHALSIPETMLEKMMQKFDIPKPGIIEPE